MKLKLVCRKSTVDRKWVLKEYLVAESVWFLEKVTTCNSWRDAVLQIQTICSDYRKDSK